VNQPLDDIHKALFEPKESDAYDNLEGALIDIERLSEQGKPTDAVCIRTIRRVLTQLHAVHNVFTALHNGAGEGMTPTVTNGERSNG
jgi:hypothetical protein